MRICHVTTGHGLTDDRIFHKEALTLCRGGYRVFVLGPSDDEKAELEGVTLEPVRAPRLRWRLLRKVVLLFRIRLKLLRLRCHVYHCHEMEAALAALPSILFGSRVVYDVHEHFPDNLRGRLPAAWLAILRMFDRFVSRSVHMVVTVDDILAAKYSWARKVIVIHNYPKLESYDSVSASADGELAVYVGGLTEDRGVWDMLEGLGRARKEHRGLRLLMVGRFIPESLREVVESRVKELELTDAVKILDWVPFEEIPEILKNAGMGLSLLRDLPRYRAAIPIKVYEYMAAGIPVIASDFDLVARLLGSERCGVLARPGSAESLSEALLALVRDRDAAQAMGKKGRIAVKREFNWEAESQVLLGGYERLVKVA
jgi:glycosyltransferase involved in cell wall biosynthesis